MVSKESDQKNEFSVLMCVYHNDDPKLFDKALNSVFSNTLLPDQFVLVVDGPIPVVLEEVIQTYSKYQHFLLIRLSENLGLVAALNEGLRHIKTAWVVRADADDFNLDNRFERLKSNMTEDLDLIGSFIAEKDDSGMIYAVKKVPLERDDVFRFIKKQNPFNHPTVAFRTSKVLALGGYPKIELREDYGLWATMLASDCGVKNIDEVLVHANAGEDMFARRKGSAVIRAEITLQSHLLKLGLTSFCGALIYGGLRTILFSVSPKIIKLIYKHVLRR